MTRFANPKAMQNFTNQFGATAAMGGNPRGNVNPKPQVGGTRPPGVLGTTGGPKPAPAVQLPTAGTRPPGTPTTGGPKPAPTGLGSAMQNNPRMAGNLGALGAGLGKRMGMKKGGKVSSASARADGCAVKGKTKGKMV